MKTNKNFNIGVMQEGSRIKFISDNISDDISSNENFSGWLSPF